jgi:hypothetical protein
VLDTVWNEVHGKEAYKESRMKNLFDLISNALGGRIQDEVNENTLWDPAATSMKGKLTEGLRACKAWAEGIPQYTQQIWTAKTHPWRDDKYTNNFINNLIKRLNELIEIRNQVKHLEIVFIIIRWMSSSE